MRIFAAMAFLTIAAAPLAAQAQSSDALLACAGTVDDVERLACYDRAVAGFSAEAKAIASQREAASAEQRAAAAAAAKARAAEQQQASFGRESMRDPPPSDVPSVDRLDAKVTEVLTDGSRRLVFLLDNGQIWRQVGTAFAVAPKPGTDVVVKSASLGSFRMLVPSRNQVIQVVRIR